MTQDELKAAVAQAAIEYVLAEVPQGALIGVGTGSTANYFIDALAAHKDRYRGAVASLKPPASVWNNTASLFLT